MSVVDQVTKDLVLQALLSCEWTEHGGPVSTYNETIQADGDFLFVTDEATIIRVPKAVLLQVLRNAGWIP